MENFPKGVPQLRLSELIEDLVGLPATTSKGNAPSKNTHLTATLTMLVSSQPASCFAHELPFSVVNAGQQPHFQLKLCTTQLGELPIKVSY